MGQDRMRAAVFLDRDGVLVQNVFYEDSGLWEAPRTPDRCKVIAGVAGALGRLRDAGFALIVVSNQPNVALGKSSMAEFEATHAAMVEQLREQGVELTASRYCVHHPRALEAAQRECGCRKPAPGMILEAAAEYGIDLAASCDLSCDLSCDPSWMVGDRATDVECGHRAGVRTILVAPDHPAAEVVTTIAPDERAANLVEAAEIILRQRAQRGG